MADINEVLDLIHEKVPANPVQKIDAAATNEVMVKLAEFAAESGDVSPAFSSGSDFEIIASDRIFETNDDDKLFLSNVLDASTGEPITYTETNEISALTENTPGAGIIYKTYKDKIVKRNYTGFVPAEWFGVSESVADNTPLIQKAIDYCLSLGGGTVFIRFGSFACLSQIILSKDVCLKGENTELSFLGATIGSGSAAVVINQTNISGEDPKEVLTGITITGISPNGQWVPGANFKDCYAIQFDTPSIIIRGVYIRGFNKTLKFRSNAYLISFESCIFRNNNFGVHFDYTGYTNLGENIKFNGCVIGNNNFGIFNNLGELNFVACSIDYNGVHISENITKVGGISSCLMSFSKCHFEAATDTIMITNNGTLSINGGAIWTDISSPGYIQNNGDLTLIDIHYRIGNTANCLVVGNKPFVFGSTYVANSTAIRLHKELNYLANGDFEGTDGVSKYTNIYNVASIATNKFHTGTKSLKVVGAQFFGGRVRSPKIHIPADKRQVFLGFYYNNFGASSTNNPSIGVYDKEDNLIKTLTLGCPVNATDVFTFVKSDWTDLDQLAVYIRLDFTTSAGVSEAVYYDNAYLWFR